MFMRYANNLTNQIKEYFPDRKLEVAFEWLPKDASVLMFKDARKSPGYNRQLWSSFFIDLYTGNPKTRKPETGNRKPETGNRKPETGNRKPESGIRNQKAESGIGTENQKPDSGIRNPQIKENKCKFFKLAKII